VSKKPYRCPICPSFRALSRPRAMIHVWSHALGNETGIPFDEVEAFLRKNLAEGRVRVDTKTGDVTPVGSWSELGAVGEAIRRVVGEVNEEQRQRREERRQARRELLDIEGEEAS
jgi:hypothetical protein